MRGTTNAWRIGVVAMVAVAAWAAMGCGGRRARVRAARMQQYEREMMRHAQRDTGCHASQLSPQQIHPDPRVYTVLGCAQPVEYWLQCGPRGLRCRLRDVPPLNRIASASLQCPPEMIQPQPTQSPMIRYATGCGRTAPYTMQCNAAACGWAQTGAVQAAGGGVYVVPQAQAQEAPAQQQVVVQGQAAAPAATLQTQVQTQREAILSCIDSATVTLRLRWTSDGQVSVQLPPELVGTAAEGCIQAAVGALRVSAQQSGEIMVPLQ